MFVYSNFNSSYDFKFTTVLEEGSPFTGVKVHIMCRVANIARYAALGRHAGFKMSAHGESVREAQAVLFVEAGRNQQHRLGFRPPRTRV